jgi:hypothetical protein
MRTNQPLRHRLHRKVVNRLRALSSDRSTPGNVDPEQPLFPGSEAADDTSNGKETEVQAKLETQRDEFKHDPLDLDSPSIRLIRIRRASERWQPIACVIRTASVASEYICLSYVWGDHHPGECILLNGKQFYVRQNLVEFLRSARGTPDLVHKWLWIDALCIDQKNLGERQHQVQQMGRIFAQAQEVVSWLGQDENIATLLRVPTLQAGGYCRPTSQAEGYRPTSSNNGYRISLYRMKLKLPSGFESLIYHSYWKRAWITQEVALGKKIKLMACYDVLDLDDLPAFPWGASNQPFRLEADVSRLLDQITSMRKHHQQNGEPGESLMSLLHLYKFQQCHVTHDQVFSLLALCQEGRDIKVDYSVSEERLALRILRCCPSSFCLCSVHILADALRIRSKLVLENARVPKLAGYGVLTLPIFIISDASQLPELVGDHPVDSLQQAVAGTTPSKVVIYMPDNDVVEKTRMCIIINLRNLCPTYRGVIRIDMKPLGGVTFDAFGRSWSSSQHEENLEVSMLPGYTHCNVQVSLAFWLYCARMAWRPDPSIADGTKSEGCCSRVSRINVPSASEEDVVPLRLSGENARGETVLRSPWFSGAVFHFAKTVRAVENLGND